MWTLYFFLNFPLFNDTCSSEYFMYIFEFMSYKHLPGWFKKKALYTLPQWNIEQATECFLAVKGGKVKVFPITGHESQEGEKRCSPTLSWPRHLDGVGFSTTPRPLYPRERPGTPCTGGRSGRVRKISAPPGFHPRTVQPVASRYTDWVIEVKDNL